MSRRVTVVVEPRLVRVPEPVAHTAAAALATRLERGGGGTARGIVIATALSTGVCRPAELEECAAWHAANPDAVVGDSSTLLGGLYGGAPARAWPELRTPPAAVAATSAPSSKLSRLSTRVNRLDRGLVNRLHAGATTAFRDAMAAVGVKIQVRANGSTAKMKAVKAADGKVTPALMAAVGVTEQELLDKRFDAYGATAAAWIAATERSKLRAVAQALNLDGSDLEDQYGDTIDRRSSAAAAFLVGALGVIASAALTGHTLTPAATQGEFSGPVPFSVARGAWAVGASGVAPVPFDHTGPGPAPVEALEQMPTAGQTIPGELVAENLGETVIARMTWVHGDPLRPFEPHEALDGASWIDADRGDILAADPGEFPYVEEYEPGDHDGCTCWIDTSYEPYEPGG